VEFYLTLREKHILQAFEKRVLRNIFGPKRNEATKGCRYCETPIILNLHQILLQYNNQIKEDKMGRASGMHGSIKNMYKILIGKPEGKRPLGRPRHGCTKWILRNKALGYGTD
jgi:hypothetical protein